MSFWVILSACVLGLLIAVALMLGRCRHCGARTYLRRSYCSICRLMMMTYADSDSGRSQGGNLPVEPAHWAASGSGMTRYENMEGGGFGVPLFLMSFGVFVFIVYFSFGGALSSKIVGTAPPEERSPTPAPTKEQVFADRRKRLYYPAQCGDGKIPSRDKTAFDNEAAAAAAGYKPAGACP